MRIDIITIFPKYFKELLSHSILKRSQSKNIVNIKIHDLRQYSNNKQKSIDDYQFGGGSGMVLCVEPIDNIISKLKAERKYDEIIYLTPDGERLTQSKCNHLSTHNNIILLCGNYKGIDERIRELHITKEISIGDFVLTGGEIPALILIDSIVRIIPGVISNETSALTDSFQDNLLSPPIYTRPAKYKNMEVPKILLSGNQKEIDKWREEESLKRTRQRRPDLLT
ncbi:MAG: tRNA (guanosine(37)-N1)-methyltransferase TrmD [Flavobacteriales bacterium]|nr:tRNA (guanosine(37)-N1)-methyltransferase TrmD [Flavobacteriales bacterium]|tara:strand:- start:15016 stop:15690 length:675 start_codon:yes stop_codon:yes gene_type:complete